MSHQLLFSLSNTSPQAKGKAVIYLSDDDQLNQLQLSITNQGAAIPLHAGSPVDENLASGESTSLLYLSFSNLFPLKSPEIAKLKISAPGWQASFQSAKGEVHNWCLAPTENSSWGSNDQLIISITGFRLTPEAMAGTLNTDYYNLQGVPDYFNQKSFSVANPPLPGNKDLLDALHLSWANNGFNQAFLTTDPGHPVKNTLSFYINNQAQKTIPVGGETQLVLFFDYGQAPGYGALTTSSQAFDLVISCPQQYGNQWTIGNPVGQVPIWPIQASGQLIGKGASGSMEVEIANLISELEPGVCQLYFSWRKIPGYNDGTISLPIEKLFPPSVQYFKCSPAEITLDTADGQVPATLSWQVDHSPNQVLIGNHGALSAVGQLPVQIGFNNKQFTLTAIYGEGQFSVNQVLDVPVSFAPPTASLQSSSTKLDFTSDSYNKFHVSWTTERAKQVTFGANIIEGIQPAAGTAPLILHSDQCQTITDYGSLRGVNLVLDALGLDGKTNSTSTQIFSLIKLQRNQPNIQALPKVISDNIVDTQTGPTQEIYAYFSVLLQDEYNFLVKPLGTYTAQILDWLNRAVNAWIQSQQSGQASYDGLATEMDSWDFSTYKIGANKVQSEIKNLKPLYSQNIVKIGLTHPADHARLQNIWKVISGTFPEVDAMAIAFENFPTATSVLEQLFQSDAAWAEANHQKVNQAFQTIAEGIYKANGLSY